MGNAAQNHGSYLNYDASWSHATPEGLEGEGEDEDEDEGEGEGEGEGAGRARNTHGSGYSHWHSHHCCFYQTNKQTATIVRGDLRQQVRVFCDISRLLTAAVVVYRALT